MKHFNISTDSSGITLEFEQSLKQDNKYLIFKVPIISLIIGFLNGFFGGGGGMLCVPFLKKCFCLEDKIAHATTLLIMLPLSIISVVIYSKNMAILKSEYLGIIIGVILGGIVGSLTLKKISNKAINIIFCIIIIYGGIRMLF